MNELEYYKIYQDVIDPTYATEFSACFDIHAYLKTGQKIRTFTPSNKEILVGVTDDSVSIKPGDRMLIPTGLIFKIPQEYSVRIHIRSSVAFKQGIFLANSEGVIDSDYFHEGFLMTINSSSQSVTIKNGDRIAQGELVQKISNRLSQIFERPEQMTDRIGGIGSTGR